MKKSILFLLIFTVSTVAMDNETDLEAGAVHIEDIGIELEDTEDIKSLVANKIFKELKLKKVNKEVKVRLKERLVKEEQFETIIEKFTKRSGKKGGIKEKINESTWADNPKVQQLMGAMIVKIEADLIAAEDDARARKRAARDRKRALWLTGIGFGVTLVAGITTTILGTVLAAELN